MDWIGLLNYDFPSALFPIILAVVLLGVIVRRLEKNFDGVKRRVLFKDTFDKYEQGIERRLRMLENNKKD